MIEGVTDYQADEQSEPQGDALLATIGTVYSDGVSLILDGQTDATQKHYKVNASVTFAAGDRVKVTKISGTYIVEYKVAATGSTPTYDPATSPLWLGLKAGKIGFYGANPVSRETLSLVKNNEGFTNVTSSNYLYVLNNLVGILKSNGLIM